MISKDTEIALNMAYTEADQREHEFVTAEHMLYALLFERSVQEAIVACGGEIDPIRGKLIQHFEQKISKRSDLKQPPQPTVAFQRILQRAVQHALSSGKENVNGATLLIAFYAEQDSFAVYFMEQQSISRFDLVQFVSHGISKPGHEDYLNKLDKKSDDMQEPSEDLSEVPFDSKKQSNSKTILSKYTTNLNQLARDGKIDPLIGRKDELTRMVQVLCRRRKNNPLLVGDSGVGKTALAEGLALQIVEQNVPAPIARSVIYSLDMGSLLAGTKFRGELEERLKALLKIIEKKKDAILFIDEIHTVIGAGAVNSGAMDMSNLLKPSLSNGRLKCIGSTTFKEYRSHFEADRAFARRFQKIDVEEPTPEQTIKILQGLKSTYEDFHNVKYSNEAIRLAVELSNRHITDRKLPDKAIDVLDEVGAAQALKTTKSNKAKNIQANDIQNIIAKMAKIPIQKISKDDRNQLRSIESTLKKVVFGQDKAILAIAAAIRTARSGLADENKPIGSFLFAGPTGVGKTEIAKQLSTLMGLNFLRFDMSEYMERHSVARLIGAPPGYIGYNDGGMLTDAVNKNPYSVLLLDEIEKAHPDVHNVLLQVLDNGQLTDSNGRTTDFRNAIIIMTSNAGARELQSSKLGFGRNSDESTDVEEPEALKQIFSPEFRNRIDQTIIFSSLSPDIMHHVVDKFISALELKLVEKRVTLKLTQTVKKWLAENGYDKKLGARPLARLIQNSIKKPLSELLLFDETLSNKKEINTIIVDLKDNKPYLTVEAKNLNP